MARKKPHQPRAGSIHAIHVKRVGYFACVITRVPEVQTREPTVFVWIDGTVRKTPEACAKVGDPTTWDGVWLGFCTTRPFTTRRWQQVDEVDGFDPHAWPVPPGLCEGYRGQSTSVSFYPDDGSMSVLACLDEPWDTAHIGLISRASDFEKLIHAGFRGGELHDYELDVLPKYTPLTSDLVERFRKAGHYTKGFSEPIACTAFQSRQITSGDVFAMPLPCGGFGAAVVGASEPRRRGRQELQLLGLSARSNDIASLRALAKSDECRIILHWRVSSRLCRVGAWNLIDTDLLPTSGRYPLPLQVFPREHAHGEGSKVCRYTWDGLQKGVHPRDSMLEDCRRESNRCWDFSYDHSVARDLGLFFDADWSTWGGHGHLVEQEHLDAWEAMDAWFESLDPVLEAERTYDPA